MAWKEMTPVEQRKEFVAMASQSEANVSLVCRRFGISRKTGYKWLARSRQTEPDWALDRSRRPERSPNRTGPRAEQAVLPLRDERPYWGGRKLRRVLQRERKSVPAASTITAILRRHGRIPEERTVADRPMERFEHAAPNEMWQMDFKGAVPTANGRCEPLVILDDHSRYALCLRALSSQKEIEVKPVLETVFRRYGLPARMLMDNGSCWGHAHARYTRLTAWVVRVGIGITHGRPYHPQTQGKCERLNRTLGEEALAGRNWTDSRACQWAFDTFRYDYNHVRPHEALGLETPASRYRMSAFEYPEQLRAIEYPASDQVRRVGPAGYVSYGNARYQVGRPFSGDRVGLRATEHDGWIDVYYCHQRVAWIDEKAGTCRQC